MSHYKTNWVSVSACVQGALALALWLVAENYRTYQPVARRLSFRTLRRAGCPTLRL